MKMLARIRALLHRRRFQEELDEELQFHLDQAAEARGSAAEALRAFGNATAIRETVLDEFVFAEVEGLWADIRLSVRSLRRNPLLLLVAVVSLGLGIGAPSILYSLIDALLIHDVTARSPERLVSFNPLSYPDYKDIRGSAIFEDLAAGNQCYPPLRWRVGDTTRQVIADCLSANFFDVVGGSAALGRVFSAGEAAPEQNPRILLISNRFWRAQLGSNPRIVGSALILNNTPFTIIGVLPADYHAIQGFGIDPDIFVPFNTALQPLLFDRQAPGLDTMTPIGRLAPGRTRAQTSQALVRVFRDLAQHYPYNASQVVPPPVLTPIAGLERYRHSESDQSVLQFSLVLVVVSLLVLFIACANVAGLLLARGVARRREIAIRMAIGAGRRRLVRQLLVEAAIVASLGAAAAAALAVGSAAFLNRIEAPVQDVTVRFAFSLNWRFALMVAALGILATFASGLIPAFSSSRSNLARALAASRGTTTPKLHVRSLLVAAQIALTVILLSGAFLFVRNLSLVLRGNPGFDTSHIVWLDYGIDRKQPPANQIATRDRIYRALDSAPGVQGISWTWYLPFQLVYSQPVIRRDSVAGASDLIVIEQGIGPGYLKTMGIPLLAGREFEWRDLANLGSNSPSVVVNEALADTLFRGGSALGQRLVRVGRAAAKPMIIIGVSGNTAFRSPGETTAPLMQSLSPITSSFIARVQGPAAAMAPDLSGIVERTVPGAGAGYSTMSERLGRATWPGRAAAGLLSVLASTGLVLALIGLCGISIYNVMRRTPEVGIRMALGATSAHIIRLMLWDGMRLVVWGTVIGITGALVLARFVRQFLSVGVDPYSPVTFIWVVAILAASAIASIWLPSRRAARIRPSVSLRTE